MAASGALVSAIARALYRHDYPRVEYPDPLSRTALQLEYEHEARVALEAVERYRESRRALR